MATRSKGGLLLPVVVIAAAAVMFGGSKLLGTLAGHFSSVVDSGTEIVGDGDSRLVIASVTESYAKQCTTTQMLTQHRCDKLNVLVVDASRIPFIARNTKKAWISGRPGLLTMNRPKQPQNREIACGRFKYQYPPPVGSCDEYPMAVTEQGGSGARTAEVPRRENSCQGGLYRPQYPPDGERFLVVISNPDKIATHDFTGDDIAKDQGWC